MASIFALAAPCAGIASTQVVSLCTDDANAATTPGTLRYASLNATSPATIDMTGLSCPNSTISLKTGAITFNQLKVTINGPGSSNLKVDGSYLSGYGDLRIFSHYGSTSLTVNGLGISGGHVYHSVRSSLGGCLFSDGDIDLNDAPVSSCHAKNIGNYASVGGAVYAKGSVTISNSSIGQNYASATAGVAFGGGLYARGDVTVVAGDISGNSATSAASRAIGGGVNTQGDFSLTTSFLSFNGATSSTYKAIGGGVYAKGGAGASSSIIKYNSATAAASVATGGGIYANGVLTLTNSNLYKNSVSGAFSLGGGAAPVGGLQSYFSTIEGNAAKTGSGLGGGIYSKGGGAIIKNSTISSNTSIGSIGGLDFFGGNYAGKTVTIQNSTVSGNSAISLIGGVYTDAATVNVFNSTIAFNTAGFGKSTNYFAPGLALGVKTLAGGISIYSSILALNTYGPSENDLSTAFASPAIVGADNLIRQRTANIPPNTMLEFACPHLGPLRDNGGRTKTHSLRSNSPAIDAGDGLKVSDFDQRGSMINNGVLDYLRISGKIGHPQVADIGAYEVQQDDVIFDVDFETCPPPPV